VESRERLLVRRRCGFGRWAALRVSIYEGVHVVVVGPVTGQDIRDVSEVAARTKLVNSPEHVVHEQSGVTRHALVTRWDSKEMAIQKAPLAVHEVIEVRRRELHDI
jgi:hypothetical protein